MALEFILDRHERLPSTNTYLKERIARGETAPEGFVVTAREQTQGRGRQGRRWISGAGENLAFSIWLPGKRELKASLSAAMAAALGVSDALRAAEVPASVKWPNDVQVGPKKICGILSECVPTGLIVGVGLNVNLREGCGIDRPVTSMRIETGRRFDLDTVLRDVLACLAVRLEDWKAGGFFAIRREWEARADGLGRRVSVRDGTASRTGVLEGFGSYGELLLRGDDDRMSTLWAGEI